jgi:hypothetical protein
VSLAGSLRGTEVPDLTTVLLGFPLASYIFTEEGNKEAVGRLFLVFLSSVERGFAAQTVNSRLRLPAMLQWWTLLIFRL